jgi:hypothetical protein
VASQEHALLADMVNCLAGVDGKHVVAIPLNDPYSKRTFQFAVGTGMFDINLYRPTVINLLFITTTFLDSTEVL